MSAAAAAASSSHRVLKGYFDRQKQGSMTAVAGSAEQSELASVFAKITLGRRNTIVAGSAAADLPNPAPAKSMPKSEKEPTSPQQVVPSSVFTSNKSSGNKFAERTVSTVSLCDTDNDSVFIRSDSLSSFASSQNLSLLEPCSSSQSTALPASTDLDDAADDDGDDDARSIRSTDTLKSSLDSLDKLGDTEANDHANTIVNRLGADEVLDKIDKVIKELDQDADRTLTEISLLDTCDLVTKAADEIATNNEQSSDFCDDG
jgi:hypothetical protein